MKCLALVLVIAVACQSQQQNSSPPPVVPGDTAEASYARKDYATCAKLYTAMTKPGALYNAACCLALDSKKDEAFEMLDRVLTGRFRNRTLMNGDPDLASLHADARWAKVLESVDANVTKYEASIKEPALRKELIALRDEDQAAREALIKNDKDQAARARMAAIDAKSTARMKEVIATYGWPGASLVGEDGASTAWLLVQHADLDRAFQKECLPLIEKAAKAGEAEEIDYAYLYDRVAIADGKPQRYGTQFVEGGPQPIEDEAHVDERRKAIGLGTMAEYAKDMERIYGKPVSSTTTGSK